MLTFANKNIQIKIIEERYEIDRDNKDRKEIENRERENRKKMSTSL